MLAALYSRHEGVRCFKSFSVSNMGSARAKPISQIRYTRRRYGYFYKS